RVRRSFAAHDESTGFLDQPAWTPRLDGVSPAPDPGSSSGFERVGTLVVGRYKLLEAMTEYPGSSNRGAPFGAENAPVFPAWGVVPTEAHLWRGPAQDRRRLASRVRIADDKWGRRATPRTVLRPVTPGLSSNGTDGAVTLF